MDHSTPQPSALKVCLKCGEAKSLSDFHKGNDKDGLRHACKACTNAQNRGIYERHKPNHLEAKRRYRSENPEARRATVVKHEEVHAEKRAAYYAVRLEIMRGNIPPASAYPCARCQEQASIYHHHSYEPEFWLDVEPLCRVCHGKEHRAYDAA